MRLISLWVLAAGLCLGQSAPQITFAAASVLDITSSWGKEELNPVLGRGTFGPRQAVTKAALAGGILYISTRTGAHHPRLTKWALYVGAGITLGIATRNYRIQSPPMLY